MHHTAGDAYTWWCLVFKRMAAYSGQFGTLCKKPIMMVLTYMHDDGEILMRIPNLDYVVL